MSMNKGELTLAAVRALLAQLDAVAAVRVERARALLETLVPGVPYRARRMARVRKNLRQLERKRKLAAGGAAN